MKIHFKAQNSYNNNTLRYSYSLEVVKCDIRYREKCQPQEKIDNLLEHLYFTMNIIQSQINFEKAVEESNTRKLGKKGEVSRSIFIDDAFHSQF
jgi:hypothetical protein